MSNSNVNVSVMSEGIYPFTPLPRSLVIAVSVILLILILAGASGNGYVCNLLRRRRDLRKVPHYLLASLSLTGFLTSLFGMPSLLINTIVAYLQIGHLPVFEIVCKLGFSLTVGFMALNALTLILMTIDRHDCVVRPFSRRLSTQNAKRIIPVTWFLAFIISAVLLVLLRKETYVCYTWFPYYFSQSFRTEKGNVIRIYVTTTGLLDTLAIVLVIITFFRVVKKLRSLVMTNSSIQQRQEKQLIWLTYGICGAYVLFRFSLIVCHIVASSEELQGTALNTAFLLTTTMLYSTFVLNPVLHFKMLRARQPCRVQVQAQTGGGNIRLDELAREQDQTMR